jgi:hypothetical protein
MRRPEFLMMRRPCAALRRPENPARSASILLLLCHIWKHGFLALRTIKSLDDPTVKSNLKQFVCFINYYNNLNFK